MERADVVGRAEDGVDGDLGLRVGREVSLKCTQESEGTDAPR